MEESATVLSYQHRGKFDYAARQQVSYLFGELPLGEIQDPEADEEDVEFQPIRPPETLKYPVDLVDRVEMIFSREYQIRLIYIEIAH